MTLPVPDGFDPGVWGALHEVRDPELDRPITDLEFVSEAAMDGRKATVHLRLPTYFCSPNFAYLMVSDAYDAVSALPGVDMAEVQLLDHFASDEINVGVNGSRGFDGAFGEEAGGGLTELRRMFKVKAHSACVDRVATKLLVGGIETDDLWSITLGQLEQGPESERLLHRRSDIGLPTGPEQYLLVDEAGGRVPQDDVRAHLLRARSARVSSDWNATFCGGLVHTRYGTSPRSEQ